MCIVAELLFEPALVEEEDKEMFSLQSYHARQKLQQLDARISNKLQAHDNLRAQKADQKVWQEILARC